MRRYFPDVLLSLLVAAVTWTVFSPALPADFVRWDDDINIYQNPNFGGLTVTHLGWIFTDSWRYRVYCPLAWLSWAVVFEFGGLQPLGYHGLNLLWHGLNAALVYLLVRQWFRGLSPSDNQGTSPWPPRVGAALGALLWALHPMQVETVAWATTLTYCQATFFLLICALCYWQSDLGTPRQSRLFYWAAILAFLASLLTYPLALGGAPVLLLLDYYRLSRAARSRGWWWGPAARRLWWRQIPFGLITAVILAATLFGRYHPASFWKPAVSLTQFGWLSRLMQAFYGWAYYLWKPWLPFDLSPVYANLVAFNPLGPAFWLSAGAILGLTVMAVWGRRRWPWGWAVWGGYLLLLLPTLGWFEHPHYTNDRYHYLVSLVWAVLFAAGVRWAWASPRWRLATVVGGLVLALLWATMSRQQIAVWQNSPSLFHHAIAKLGDSPYCGDLYYRLGLFHKEQGENRLALECFERVMRFRPRFPAAYSNLADTLVRLGQLEPAIPSYREALRLAPGQAQVRLNLGAVLLTLGQLEEAAYHFTEVLRLRPDQPQAHEYLALIRQRQGQLEAARVHQTEARRLRDQPKAFGQQ